jgi:hypothetical protein
MTTLYNETQIRLDDFLYCLSKNANNPLFEQMIILYDTHKDVGESTIRKAAQDIKHAIIIEIKDRPTFADFFSIANSQFSGKNILVCNSDIYYDESLSLIKDRHLDGIIVALERWTHPINGFTRLVFDPSILTASADTWIFRSPLPVFKSDFRLGMGYCDGRLAFEAREAGIKVMNPCKSIKSYHVHNPEHKNDERDIFYVSIPDIMSKGLPACRILETPATEIW